ncbi:MAG: hypothetical protein ACU0DX_09955 [Roseovarius sp.]|uniref:hypothetical protein n=1 Tax=Roseovarius sp. TaxID=1486281 RepID=UPI002606AB34|nr:hypothetical protein [Roseovarius sp.]
MSKKTVHSCFFVTPIGGDATPQRKRADDLLTHLLRPISKDFLDIVRADEVDEPGTITSDIVRRLHTAELVIADLTGQNPNVMYEIGLRHCFNLPIVHLAQTGEKPPFDLAAERIIFFDIADIASVEAAKGKIKKACQAALEAKPFRSPVVRALELESLFASVGELPMPRDLIEKLDQLESKLDEVSGDLSTLSFSIDSGITVSADGFDISIFERINEIIRLFDRVSPSDVARLADALKTKHL